MISENWLSVLWHRYYRRDQFLFRHYQHTCWVMFMIDKGQCRYRIRDVEGVAGKGDLLIIPARTEIEQVVVEPMRFHFAAFEWLQPRGSDDEAFEQVKREAPQMKLTIADQGRFLSTSEQLRKLASMDGKVQTLVLQHYINDLWLLGRLEERNRRAELSVTHDSLMSKAKLLLEEQALQPVVLKHIAASLYLSSVQFSRRYQAAFGVSPMDFVTSLRMEKARSLLEETQYTVEHVAHLCGFESRNYFCRLFAKHTNLSPSIYRKIHQI